LKRLDRMSQEPEGLDLAGLKQLDLLIKCHASFVGHTPTPAKTTSTSPEASPVEALLEGLTASDDESDS